MFPIVRHRRLRQNASIRALVRETLVTVDDLIAPLFVVPGERVRKEISSLEGQYHLSVDQVVEESLALQELGIRCVLLFGLPPSKDDKGAVSYHEQGVVQQALRAIKKASPDLMVAADLCFCEYTTHGHCGVVVNGDVDNDKTLIETEKQARSLAEAGADIIAPSGMMDGMVQAIRHALDSNGFEDRIILSYSAKYASSYYGPFREAVACAPEFGNRATYQMDPGNSVEALREVASDIEEGADMVMVKPALPYLDIIRKVKENFAIPLAAYNVSGEYAMIKNAAKQGLIDGRSVMQETLLSIKRAGADLIITYFAKEFASLTRDK